MDKNTYLREVVSLVRSKYAKREIYKELEAHIDDRINFYIESGYDEQNAEQRAIEHMGEASSVAKNMQKLHNNTHWCIMSIAFLVLYCVGLLIASVKEAEFAFVNISDFMEISEFPCFASVLTFFALALSFHFAKKSESSRLLLILGILSGATPILSMYALIPFGYQVVGLFTDFPAAIIQGEYYFECIEVFYSTFDLFPETIGIYIFYALCVIMVLVSLLCVIIGIVSIVYSFELNREKSSPVFEKRVKRFSLFLIILATVTLVGTCAEWIYDYSKVSTENAQYEGTQGLNLTYAKNEFDRLFVPMTKEEVLSLANEKGLMDFQIKDMELGMITIFENPVAFVQLNDYNNDGIYENKRYCRNKLVEISLKQLYEIEKLEKGSGMDELYEIIDFGEIDEFLSTADGNDIITTVYLNGGDYWLEYKNAILTDSNAYAEEVEE